MQDEADGGARAVVHAGPFRLTRRLGEGAFCEVWQGVHPASEERVAVKLLKPQHRARWRGAMRREAHAIARVEHPGVVWIHDAGEDEIVGPWLAIELASGGTLLDRAPASWAGVRAVLADLLAALAHLHARGILHRDVKPANVLICTLDDPRPGTRLADFALATVGADRGPRGGTPDYAAPEQRRGDLADEGPWTDLFALGGLAWWLVCGEPRGHAPYEPRFAVPVGLADWLDGLLAPEPWNRPRTAAAALAALQALGAVADDPPPPNLGTYDDHRPARGPHPRRSAASLGLSGLRPVPVIGRSEERRALRAAMATVVAGGGPTVVRLVGPSGLGKMHLVTDLVTEVLDGGFGAVVQVSAGAGSLGDGLRAGLVRALDTGSLRDPAALRTHLVRWGHEPADRLAAWLSGADEDGVDVVLAWARARRGLVVLTLDDLPRGEAAAALVRRLATCAVPNLLVLATAVAVSPQPPVVDLPLAPLAEPIRLVRALGIVDPALAEQLAARSGGVPALVVTLVRELVRTGSLVSDGRGYVLAPGASLPTPERLAAEVWSRVPVAPRDRAALEVLALLGGVGEAETWMQACRALGLPEVAALSEAWSRSGLVQLSPSPRVADPLLAALLVEELVARGAAGPFASAVAEALAAMEVTEERSEQLGVVSMLAGAWERAAPLLASAAGDHRHGDNPERSHVLLDQAMACLEHTPVSAEHEEQTSKVQLMRALVLCNEGRSLQALQHLAAHPPVGAFAAWRHPLLQAQLATRVGRPFTAVRLARAALLCCPDGARDMVLQVIGRSLLEQGDVAGALAQLTQVRTFVAAVDRVHAWLELGDVVSAERELRAMVDPPWLHRGWVDFLKASVKLVRGEPAFHDLTLIWEGPHAAVHRGLAAFVSVVRLQAAVREGLGGLVELEAHAQEAVATAGARSIVVRRALEDAAAHAPHDLAERLWVLAESQAPLESE